ncbi:MAG TPA: hypothetical protein VMH37_15385 [Candidatus Binataceae bacterium]|nr:hypothetical protein [Candidatus Binataceae bacterium]
MVPTSGTTVAYNVVRAGVIITGSTVGAAKGYGWGVICSRGLYLSIAAHI